MKQIWIFAVLLLLLAYAPLRAEDTKDEVVKPVSPKQVSQKMAAVWCEKMEECDPKKEMSISECQKILFASFKRGFARFPKEKPLNIDPTTLDQCAENITKVTCDSLKGARSLPNCEFIGLLGQ